MSRDLLVGGKSHPTPPLLELGSGTHKRLTLITSVKILSKKGHTLSTGG